MLIGAVALAFIILGIVVVFNGVIYTETLSSADTSQRASSAETTELEVRQGVGCLLNEDDEGLVDSVRKSNLEEEIENEYSRLYRNATAHSQPAVVDLETDPSLITLDDSVTVTITYDSNDLTYERDVEISAEECPS
uniref:Flagellin n=1 Tax=Haloterrigena alkaliphila TaxID=2816475 RepID=A0A8A2VKZ4_9EURY